MIFETKYEAYNSSWEKFIVWDLLYCTVQNTCKLLTSRSSIHFLIAGSYFIHNLYEQYQHNKSLEKKLTVETGGEVKEITASPNYFDAYTYYNISAVITMGIMTHGVYNNSTSAKDWLSLAGFTFIMEVVFKVYSAFTSFTSNQKYNFTDQNGNSVSAEELFCAEILSFEHNSH